MQVLQHNASYKYSDFQVDTSNGCGVQGKKVREYSLDFDR